MGKGHTMDSLEVEWQQGSKKKKTGAEVGDKLLGPVIMETYSSGPANLLMIYSLCSFGLRRPCKSQDKILSSVDRVVKSKEREINTKDY